MRLKTHWSFFLFSSVSCQSYLTIDPTFVKGGYSDDGYKVTNTNQPTSYNTSGELSTDVEIPQFENCHEYTENYGYECVPYYQCQDGTIVTDGSGLIDIRNGFGPESSACPGDQDVCCKDPDFVPPPPEKIIYAPKCGQRNQDGLGLRIMGSNENDSQFGEWPHMCAVLYEQLIEEHTPVGEESKPEVVNLFQCGGSLIAPGVILTAAHCVKRFESDPTRLKVRCGEWDTQNQNEPYPHQDRKIKNLNVHPEFNDKNLHNDFAVLFTAEEFQLSSHIDTVCLPDLEEEFIYSNCFASGWGKDKFGSSGEYQVILKEIDLPIVSHDDCQESLRQTKLGEKFKLDESFICAGGVGGKDTCHGDGGSPLVCPSKENSNTFTQAGIVSWGVGCGESGSPGVYSAVSSAVCWIDHAVSCSNGDSNFSYLGLDRQKCQTWVDGKIDILEKKKEQLPDKLHVEIDNMIRKYQTCNLEKEEINETPSSGYGPTDNTNNNTYNENQEEETDNNSSSGNAPIDNSTNDTYNEKQEKINENPTSGYGQTDNGNDDTYNEKQEETKGNQTTGYGQTDNDNNDSYNETININTNERHETQTYANDSNKENTDDYNNAQNNTEENKDNATGGGEFGEEFGQQEVTSGNGGEETGSFGPDDYAEPDSGSFTDHSTTEVDETFENCVDYSNKGYSCVPYYQCHNGSIIADGAGLIDIRNGFGELSPKDSKCNGFLDVCCKDPGFVQPPLPPQIDYVSKCGQRHQNGLGVRIQGFKESESQFGEWPHMCAVLHEKSLAGEQPINLYLCGASLIAPGVVLTAGHCVDKFREKPSELKVRCGEWDTQNETEPYPHQERRVEDFKIHPLFHPQNLQNDFAVLFTESDFVPQKHIDTVCLPQVDEVFDGETCFATGWGKDQFGSAGEYQVVLKEIDLPVVNNTYCQDSLRTSRLGPKFKLDESFVCAGGVNGKDTCKGDGGSPLVCPSTSDRDTYVQVGIVAWGVGCGEFPGVYASVSKAMCWVDYVMSCYLDGSNGEVDSYNQYTSAVCKPYMDNLKSSIQRLPRPLYQKLLSEINQCSVKWEHKTSNLEKANDNSYVDQTGEGNYSGDQITDNTSDQTADNSYSADQTADNKSDQTADNSYSADQTADNTSDQTADNTYSADQTADNNYTADQSVDNKADETADIVEENIPEPVYK